MYIPFRLLFNKHIKTKKMSYTDLPAEILINIASHLDISSAISLAQTSSFSHQAAESRIWGDIKIDYINRFYHDPSPEEEIDEMKNDLYGPYISLIPLRPWRSTLVRSLVVEPQFTPSPDLSHLLKLISGGVHHLRIMYPTGLLVPLSPLKIISQIIEDIALPALEEIEVDIGDWGCLVALLRGSRGLKKLTVRGPESLGSVTASAMALGMGMSGIGTSDTITANIRPEVHVDIPEVLHLEYLSIDRVDTAVIPLLAKIVANSPRLKTVIIGDSLNLWFPFSAPSISNSNNAPSQSHQDPLLLALSENISITSLDIPSTSLEPMEDIISHSGGFTNIKTLTIVWEFPQLYACSGGKDRTLQSEILLPTLPNLEKCIFTLRTHHCDPNAPPYSIYRGYIFDLSIKAIKRHALLTHFGSTPLLESIQLRDMYGTKSTGSHPRCETEFDGALIMRYKGSEGISLVVLRHRVAHSCGWEEYGVYEGREVPKSCLDGVMSVNGVSGREREQVEPGWGELNDEAWEVLRHWSTLL